MISRSAPPWTRPRACSSKIATSSGKRIWPSVASSEAGRCPVGPIEPATKQVLADGAARDLDGLDVDLERVVGETPLVELQAAGLEGVGLDHLRAGGDHRRVHALDDVGPVEHERLVALAGQAAVVGGGEVDLLERRAHPAVEHDDSLANGGKVVTRHSPQASRKSANLDTAVSRPRGVPERPTPAGWRASGTAAGEPGRYSGIVKPETRRRAGGPVRRPWHLQERASTWCVCDGDRPARRPYRPGSAPLTCRNDCAIVLLRGAPAEDRSVFGAPCPRPVVDARRPGARTCRSRRHGAVVGAVERQDAAEQASELVAHAIGAEELRAVDVRAGALDVNWKDFCG